jgi:hypothetical protein
MIAMLHGAPVFHVELGQRLNDLLHAILDRPGIIVAPMARDRWAVSVTYQQWVILFV